MMVRRLLALTFLFSFIACSSDDSGPSVEAASEWTMLAHEYGSSYHNRSETVLSTRNVGELELDWRFEARGSVNGAAAVVDGIIYVLSGGALYALDAVNQTVIWENTAISGTSSPTYSEGKLFVQAGRGEVVAVDATDGTELWRADVDPHPISAGYSSPVVFERYVIVGSSSNEEGAVAEAATFRGAVVAYDRDSGEELWRFYTVEPPDNGATVWSSVSIDPDMRAVFASTGNNYTEEGDQNAPAVGGPTSDSLFSLDVDTGELIWLTQLTKGDVFTILNPRSPDTDFGTNPILIDTVIDGRPRKLVAAGQKSGVFWALDRVTGEVVWSTAVSPGSALIGGFLNNGAYDGERIIAAGANGTSDAPGSEDPVEGTRKARLVAMHPATGEILWERQIGGWAWAPITIANGVGYLAADFIVQAFDVNNGEKLFSFPTEATITSAPVVAEGRVHFGSGVNYFATTRGRDFFVLSLDGRGTGGSTGPGDGTTFTAIYDDIIVGQGCNTSSCHGANQGNLQMTTRNEAYANLVGVPASGFACTEVDLDRVEPGAPGASLLLNKLVATLPLCGGPMPPTEGLSPEDIARVRKWIEDGAKDN